MKKGIKWIEGKVGLPFSDFVNVVVLIVSILALCIAGISLKIAIYSLKSAEQSGIAQQTVLEASRKSLESVVDKMNMQTQLQEQQNKLSKDMQDQLSKLPKNLDKLNSAVKDMSENARVQGGIIRENLGTMEKSVIDFSKTISASDKHLKSILEIGDKQLALIREQQRKIEEDAKRSPDLAYTNNKISKSSNGKISIYPGVINIGNKMADEVILYIEFPSELNIETRLPSGTNLIHKDYVQFSVSLGTIHPSSGGSFTSKNTPVPVIIDTTKHSNKKIPIYYVIVDSANSYSGSLMLDVESLKMDMGKREINKP
ncbi:MAG: hypothetical protein HZB33_00840 [Nitrospirae bacterium]|nr:hypothetical protein [Nitrospirota bacterium]